MIRIGRLSVTVTGLILSSMAVAQSGVTTQVARAPDESFISLQGEVGEVSADSFLLRFKGGEIIVEMDDGDRDADAYALQEGDKVAVRGRVDDDLFESRSLEASAVYVEKLDTHFFSSSVDEEDFDFAGSPITFEDEFALSVQGTVSKIDEGEFTVETGLRDITVNVAEMSPNPIEGSLSEGDVVSVTGNIAYGFIETGEVIASSVIKIHDSGDI